MLVFSEHRLRPSNQPTAQSPALIASNVCRGVASFDNDFFGKGIDYTDDASNLYSAAVAADESNPRYDALATAVNHWLSDVSSTTWAENGKPHDAQTKAVANACASLRSAGDL